MLNYLDILKKLEVKMDDIKRFGVIRIGLFGSFARDTQSEKSDIDILVEFEKSEESFNNYMGLLFFLEELFSQKVDLVISDNVREELKEEILGSVKYVTEL